jgi:hypothetical protein
MNSPKWRLPISSFATVKTKLGNRGRFSTIRRIHTPKTKAMFTTLEPKTLPMETPTLDGLMTAKTDTLNSGMEVEKPTKMKPTVVFPKPVNSETLIEFFMVTSLAMTKMRMEASRISALPTMPTPSNSIRFTFSLTALEQQVNCLRIS